MNQQDPGPPRWPAAGQPQGQGAPEPPPSGWGAPQGPAYGQPQTYGPPVPSGVPPRVALAVKLLLVLVGVLLVSAVVNPILAVQRAREATAQITELTAQFPTSEELSGTDPASQQAAEDAAEDVAAAAGGVMTTVGAGFAVASGVVSFIVGLVYLWLAFMVRKGRNWARVTATVLIAIGLVVGLPGLFGIVNPSITTLLHYAQYVLLVAIVVLLWQRQASAWFDSLRPARQQYGYAGQGHPGQVGPQGYPQQQGYPSPQEYPPQQGYPPPK